jgi:hypothetical protein
MIKSEYSRAKIFISSRPPVGAASKSQYDENLPIVKDMIDSFTVEETGQVIQDDVEEDSDDEGPNDTFVGSAGNNDEDNGSKRMINSLSFLLLASIILIIGIENVQGKLNIAGDRKQLPDYYNQIWIIILS